MIKAIESSALGELARTIHRDFAERAKETLSRKDEMRKRLTITRARLAISITQYEERVRDHLRAAYYHNKDVDLVWAGEVVRYDRALHAKEDWTLRCLHHKNDCLQAIIDGNPPPPVPFKPGQKVTRNHDGTLKAEAQPLCYRAGELAQRAEKEAAAIMRKINGGGQ